ncbi:sigma 54-interacting transcriptional regulator [uncultured Clostridium sp.]|uniref:sigma-54 interaction domain-containing protein n=1 Tax=uncultured Clostridium sp. TaxID=59620 RepID=UPI0028E34800|nr:sigma 54-interacting transcriptional regulator [uncultured Clostridium sp.]
MSEIIDTKLTEEEFKNLFVSTISLIFNQMPIPINFVDSDCNEIFMNKAFLNYLGLELEDVIGKHITEIDPFVRLPIVVKTGRAEIGQKHRFKDGREVIVHRLPIFYGQKIIGGIGIILIDDLNYLYDLAMESNLINKLNPHKKSRAVDVYKAKYTFEDIFTQSSEGNSCKLRAEKYAKTDFTVLITGESGTGKELFAHSIHNHSNRKEGPFVSINCASIPKTLIESELFGYEEGSFTGANKSGRVGKFEIANGGTIFLDEIGDLPLDMQAKLLRVLQENEIQKIGSNKIINVDVRVIAATNCNIMEMVKDGKFRSDLFYRLNVLNLNIPPLRERKEDIKLLIEHFNTELYQDFNICKKFNKNVIEVFLLHKWPGNIRELKNVVTSSVVNALDDIVEIKNIPQYIMDDLDFQESNSEEVPENIKISIDNNSLTDAVYKTEEKLIIETLKSCNFNKTEAAKKLGISRMSLYRKLKNIQLER